MSVAKRPRQRHERAPLLRTADCPASRTTIGPFSIQIFGGAAILTTPEMEDDSDDCSLAISPELPLERNLPRTVHDVFWRPPVHVQSTKDTISRHSWLPLRIVPVDRYVNCSPGHKLPEVPHRRVCSHRFLALRRGTRLLFDDVVAGLLIP
jgi:hypothetical protein